MTAERWTEAEARRTLEAWSKSGQSIAEFARNQGHAPFRLYEWRRKLEAADRTQAGAEAPSPLPALVPVRVTRAAPVDASLSVVLRSGHVIKVARDFDEDVFSRVVALLESTGC